jgi:hypothetical protein
MIDQSVVNTITAVLLPVNTALLVGVIFYAGRLVQKVEDIDRRVTRLEGSRDVR